MTLTIKLCTGKEIELTSEEWEELKVVFKDTNYIYPPFVYPYGYPSYIPWYPYITNGTSTKEKYREVRNE